MELELNVAAFFAALITGSAVIVAFTVAAMLIRLPAGRRPTWLILLLTASAILLINSTISIGGLPRLSSHLYYLPFDYSFSIGPFLYFYARHLLKPEIKFSRQDLVHLILPALQALLYAGLGFSSINLKYRFYQEVDIPWFGFSEMAWIFGNVLIYGAAVVQMLRQVDPAAPPLSKEGRRWLKGLAIATLSAVSIALLFDELLPALVMAVGQLDLYQFPIYGVVSTVVVSIALWWISINAYRYTLRSELVTTQESSQIRARKETYAIDDSQLATDALRLNMLMAEQAPYRDPNLTLFGLATQLDLTSKQLSYIINEATGQNFNSYINHKRIDEAKTLLSNPSNKHRAVLDLAFEAGFSSKSTFNRVFKEIVGCSPSQFRSAQLSE